VNPNLARFIISAWLLVILGTVVLRLSGKVVFWERWSTRAIWAGVIGSIIGFVVIALLWSAGWFVKGQAGSIGVAWLFLITAATMTGFMIQRSAPTKRRGRSALVAVAFVAVAALLGFLEWSLVAPTDGWAWSGSGKVSWQARLAADRGNGDGTLCVAIFRRSERMPALEKRIYDHSFSVRTSGSPTVNVMVGQDSATVTYCGEVLETVAINVD